MNDSPAPQVLFTFEQTAHMTGLRESWLRKAVAARRIAHRRLGKHVRFAQADLDALIAQTAVAPAASPLTRKTA